MKWGEEGIGREPLASMPDEEQTRKPGVWSQRPSAPSPLSSLAPLFLRVTLQESVYLFKSCLKINVSVQMSTRLLFMSFQGKSNC